MGATLNFLSRQLFVTPTHADPHRCSLIGQCGIVTGSNAGLGYEAAKQLLELGINTLILAVRSLERGAEARERLLASSSYPEAEILVWQLDMCSYDSIQAFVARCQDLPRLDFALLNAGVVKFDFEANEQTGHEQTIQVNVLSTSLLALLLVPVISEKKKPAGPGKITIVGSEVAEFAKFKARHEDPFLPYLDNAKAYDAVEQYNVSKLLQQYFVSEVSRRIDREKVVVNIANPGFCYGSNLHREVFGAMGKILGAVKRGIGRSCEVGARPLVKAAVAEGEASHGKYYQDNSIADMAPLTRGSEGEKLAARAWKEITGELKLAIGGVVIEGLQANVKGT